MGVNRIASYRPYLLLNNELEPYFLTISEYYELSNTELSRNAINY